MAQDVFKEVRESKEFLELQHATREDIFRTLEEDYRRASELTDDPAVRVALIEASSSVRGSTAILQASQNQAEALKNIAEALKNSIRELGDRIQEGFNDLGAYLPE